MVESTASPLSPYSITPYFHIKLSEVVSTLNILVSLAIIFAVYRYISKFFWRCCSVAEPGYFAEAVTSGQLRLTEPRSRMESGKNKIAEDIDYDTGTNLNALMR